MTVDGRFTKPPVIIGGCGRSGTTLLLSVLSAHPSILAIPYETNVFCPTAYSKQVDFRAALEIYRLREILKSTEVKAGATRWCEKTPKNILFFGRILEALEGNVKLINIVRDGRDVVASRHPERPDSSWITMERWIQDVRAGVRFDRHRQVLVVRYEDLILSFPETVSKICGFIDEPVDAKILDYYTHATVRTHAAWSGNLKDLHGKSVGKWQRGEYTKTSEQLMSDLDAVRLLRHYGYIGHDAPLSDVWKTTSMVRMLKRRVPPALKSAAGQLIGRRWPEMIAKGGR